MTPVDPASQLAALIQAQASALRQQRKIKTPPAARSAKTSAAPDINAIVAKRLQAIDANDPKRKRLALRIFLETVILSELGQNLVNDPSFSVMLDHIEAQMQAEPSLANACDETARVLLEAADAASPKAPTSLPTPAPTLSPD